ncbi:MAG: OmpA family protein [Salibacteraceae bacterium]
MNQIQYKLLLHGLSFALVALLLPHSTFAQEINYDFGTASPVSAINTSDNQELMPLLSPDGKTLFFVKQFIKGGKNVQNIWSAPMNNQTPGSPSEVPGPINNDQDNALAGINITGDKLFLLNSYNRKSTEFIEVSYSSSTSEGWARPKWFETPELFTLGQFYDFYVTPDEEVLLISMEGSKEDKNKGKEDLYVCFKTPGGNWSGPVNLGATINTKGFEMTPFLSEDKMTLYFSSNGRKGGMGDADIYMSKRQAGSWVRWSEPVNLGPEINSKGLDAYFKITPDQQTALFASTRDGSFDIFSTPVTKTVIPAAVATKEPEEDTEMQNRAGVLRFGTMAAKSVELKLMDEQHNVLQTVTTDENGYFEFDEFVNDKNYLLAINENDTDRLKQSELYLSNDINDRLAFLENQELGLFAFKALSIDKYEDFDKLKQEANAGKVVSNAKIAGVFRHGSVPTDSVELTIADESGQVLLTTTTDENGAFVIEDFVPQKNYLIAIDDNNSGLAEVFEVFMTGRGENSTVVINKLDKYLFSFKSLPNEDVATSKNLDSLMLATKANLDKLSKEPPLAINAQPGGKTKPAVTSAAATGDASNTILFENTSYRFGSNSETYTMLNSVIKELEANPQATLSIEGHTCDRGSESTNLRISELRALNTRNYLIAQGIAADRLTIRFYGEQQPAVPNTSEEARQQNRRVVLSIN